MFTAAALLGRVLPSLAPAPAPARSSAVDLAVQRIQTYVAAAASLPTGAAAQQHPTLYRRSWRRRRQADQPTGASDRANTNQSEPGPASRSVTVVQFNVLADGLSGRRLDHGNFDFAPLASLEWSYRRDLLLDEIFRCGLQRRRPFARPRLLRFFTRQAPHIRRTTGATRIASALTCPPPRPPCFATQPLCPHTRTRTRCPGAARHGVLPDVVCLEEVDHYGDWFQPVMQRLGYEGRYVAKLNSPCKNSLDPTLEDGCALFWRRAVLDAVSVDEFRYVELDSAGARTNERANQCALIATLRPRGGAAGDADAVVFVATHLVAKKSEAGERWRADQVRQLLDHLAGLGRPCVVLLDMNAAPSTSGIAPYPPLAYTAALEHRLAPSSAYAALVAGGAEPGWTTWKRRKGQPTAKHTIDYVLVTGGVTPLAVLDPPADDDVDPERLPGWRYPSDHVALFAELALPGGGGGEAVAGPHVNGEC